MIVTIKLNNRIQYSVYRMEKIKPKSLTRIPIQLYPEVKEEFDQLHETMGTVNTSETVKILIDCYKRNNEAIKV